MAFEALFDVKLDMDSVLYSLEVRSTLRLVHLAVVFAVVSALLLSGSYISSCTFQRSFPNYVSAMASKFGEVLQEWERRIAEHEPGEEAIRDAAKSCSKDLNLLLDVLTKLTDHRGYQDRVDAARERGVLDGLAEMHALVMRVVPRVGRVSTLLETLERGGRGRAEGGDIVVGSGQVRGK